jgi:ATP-dependent Zn protease
MKRIFSSLALALSLNALACNDHDLQQPEIALQVINTSVSTAKTQGPMLVTVIGEIKNTTTERIDNLILEAKLTDSNGKVIDVLSESMYGMVVPAGEQISFRLQGAAATTEATYANAQVRVVSAEGHSKSTKQSSSMNESKFAEFAISWGPLVLLILVWGFFVRKYNGKGSNQSKMLTAINDQNALLARQSSAVEAIAAVLNSSKKID